MVYGMSEAIRSLEERVGALEVKMAKLEAVKDVAEEVLPTEHVETRPTRSVETGRYKAKPPQ